MYKMAVDFTVSDVVETYRFTCLHTCKHRHRIV